MALEPDAKVPVGVLESPEVLPVRREFHILRALIQEYLRLQSIEESKVAARKLELLRVEIRRLARQMEAMQNEMTAEERRILAEGLTTLPNE